MAYMATWGNTTFYEYVGRGAPDEQYSEQVSRVVRTLDVVPGTLAARQQALADFLGYSFVATGAAGQRYISRKTPLPAPWQAGNSGLPAQQYLYAANITHGEAIAPNGTTITPSGATGLLTGADFLRYRFTVEFTSRTFDIWQDSQVLAFPGVAIPQTGQYPISPLTGLPDEGQLLSGACCQTSPSAFGTFTTTGQPTVPLPSQWPPNPGNTPKFQRTRYITRLFRPSSRMAVLPKGMCTWASSNVSTDANLPVQEGSAIVETMAAVQYTHHQVPENGIPFLAIQSQANTVNLNWFDGFSPGTLLFKSADLERYVNWLGQVFYNVHYQFSWLPKPNILNPAALTRPAYPVGVPMGWNSQIRVVNDAAGIRRLCYDFVVDGPNSSTPPFPYSDFAALFRPDQTI